MGRVLVIGLDGATFDLIRPLAAQGRLPNLAFLMREGAWGILRSTIPPITPTAWTTFFTGKNPGRHGIYDFQEIDPQTYQFRSVRVDRHREKRLWQLLGEAGLTSIVVDVPYTHPPHPMRGWMITGYGTPRTPGTVFTYPQNLADLVPESLRSEIRVALPRHRFDRSTAFIREWSELMDGRRRLLRYLISEREWDFFMVVFSITDNMAHVFWTFVEPTHPNFHRPEAPTFREALFQAYARCDALVGELMEWAGPETTVLVMSDHGFGSVRPRQYLFHLLNQGGYLHYKSPPFLSLMGDRLIRAVTGLYTGFPLLREWIKRLRPERRDAVKGILRRGGIVPGGHSIDPTRSRILPSNFGLQMWVHERGAFAQGIVSPEEKERLLAELEDYLHEARDPVTGEPTVRSTYRGADLYHGPEAPRGPDLVIEYANFYRPDVPSSRPNPYLEGGHTLEGILLAYGPPIRPGSLEGATLMDLTPTILHLFGQPVPPDMDGRVLEEMFTSEYRTAHPVRRGRIPARLESGEAVSDVGYTPEEEEEIAEQLRQLGYM